jgi:hypothetical protein
MKTLSVMLAVLLVVGCGGVEGGETVEVDGGNTVSAYVDRCETNPNLPECYEGGGDPVYTYKTLNLELWNAVADTRICQYTWSHLRWDGTTATGAVLAAAPVAADEWRHDSLSVPYGRTATLTATCWHPNYPTVALRASTTLATLPMDRTRTCRATYDETYGPTMYLTCWVG